MARKSLSSQITDEVDRLRDLLKPLQDISDPMTGHVIGQALIGLHRIEGLCLKSTQNVVNAILEDQNVDDRHKDVPAPAPARKRAATAHKAPARRAVKS